MAVPFPHKVPGAHGALCSNPTVLGELWPSRSRLWCLSRPTGLSGQPPGSCLFHSTVSSSRLSRALSGRGVTAYAGFAVLKILAF